MYLFLTRNTCSLREPSRGSCYYMCAYFTPRGPRITHPKNGCDRFSRFCGTWEQTDGRTDIWWIIVRYSIMKLLSNLQDNGHYHRSMLDVTVHISSKIIMQYVMCSLKRVALVEFAHSFFTHTNLHTVFFNIANITLRGFISNIEDVMRWILILHRRNTLDLPCN